MIEHNWFFNLIRKVQMFGRKKFTLDFHMSSFKIALDLPSLFTLAVTLVRKVVENQIEAMSKLR